MGTTSTRRGATATPLGRYAEWYDALSPDLRAHLAPHLFGGGLAGLDAYDARSRARGASPIAPRLEATVDGPAREADLATGLALRTDRVLSDPVIREQWTGEGALAALGADTHDAPRRLLRDRALARTVEWMRAVEQWASLREGSLAAPRIERWLAKREEPEGRAG